MTRSTKFSVALAGLLLAGFAVRLFYVWVQPDTDPAFASPGLDGAYYLEWARSLASGGDGPGGAYYLAPLYPFLLWGFLEAFGESFAALYVLQQLAHVLAAGLLALCGRKLVNEGGGLCAAGLLLLYHPALYFASRPTGEPAALLLLVSALYLVLRSSRLAALAAGVVGGLAVLARPNLLLILAVWAGVEAARRNWARCGLIIAGTALALLPVTMRNAWVSGHFVPVSSNAGITLYHGNGPGARGTGTMPAEFSGKVANQREEATRVASRLSGQTMDAVEADRWWGRQAIRARLDDPSGTALLLLRRAALLGTNVELGLNYAPAIDLNPWRWSAPVRFGLLLGLAAAGLYFSGWRGSGGSAVWAAVLACTATPLLFYASSRYRLPLAVLLCLPAGAGLWGLVRTAGRRRFIGFTIGAAVVGASVALPIGDLQRTSEAGAWANRAVAWKRIGELDRAAVDLDLALSREPDCVQAHFGLGVLFEEIGRADEAEAHYQRVLELNPASAEAAGNLARSWILRGRAAEAVPVLRRALEHRPGDEVCWVNLVAALYALDDAAEGLKAADQAAQAGVVIDPVLIEGLRRKAARATRRGPEPRTIANDPRR